MIRFCPSGKLAYCSREEAEAAIRRYEERDRKRGDNPAYRRSYDCPKCPFWHTTRRTSFK